MPKPILRVSTQIDEERGFIYISESRRLWEDEAEGGVYLRVRSLSGRIGILYITPYIDTSSVFPTFIEMNVYYN